MFVMKNIIFLSIVFFSLALDICAQDINYIVFRNEGKVYLRWQGIREPQLDGYNIYRTVQGESRQKLNDELLSIETNIDSIRIKAGDYIGGIYLAAFGLEDPAD